MLCCDCTPASSLGMQAGEDRVLDELVRMSKLVHGAMTGASVARGGTAYADLLLAAAELVDRMLLDRVVAPMCLQQGCRVQHACRQMCELLVLLEDNSAAPRTMQERDVILELHEGVAELCTREMEGLGM